MTTSGSMLARGPAPSPIAALRSLHRLEVGPMYLFVLIWGMFVAAHRPSSLWAPASILAFLINGLSLFSGFVLNAYSDYPIDIRSPIKAHIAQAVQSLGRRTVLVIYVGEQVATVALAVIVSAMLHNYAFVAVKLVGILSGYVYNAEPTRLKRRGLWNPAMMAVRFGFVPGLIAYLAVHHGVIRAGGWVLLAGMTLISLSRGFWNAISDTNEDAAEGIRTPAVAYGAAPTMAVAVITLVPACGLIAGGLAILFGPWAAAGVAGALGALGYRARLLRGVQDSRSAVELLRTPSIRRVDAQWSKFTYYAVVAIGIAHFMV